MAYSKVKKILFILLCIFIIIFPFALITKTFATEGQGEEEVQFEGVVTGITLSSNSNVFVSNGGGSKHTGYITIEPGYIYYIYNNASSIICDVAQNNDIPTLGGSYDFLYSIPVGGTYTYRGSGGYLYLSFTSNNSGSYPTITRTKLTSMDGAVGELVDNVGINSIWNVFDISINYIVIVVLVAFGLFIVYKLIKRVSKGKSGGF